MWDPPSAAEWHEERWLMNSPAVLKLRLLEEEQNYWKGSTKYFKTVTFGQILHMNSSTSGLAPAISPPSSPPEFHSHRFFWGLLLSQKTITNWQCLALESNHSIYCTFSVTSRQLGLGSTSAWNTDSWDFHRCLQVSQWPSLTHGPRPYGRLASIT